MRSSRSLPAIAALGLATVAVVPASCSSVSEGGAYDASDASVAELFGTTAAALTSDTINSSGSTGLAITLDADGRLAIRDRILSPSTDLFKIDSSKAKAAIGVSVGSTLCHASVGSSGLASGGVQTTGSGTQASPYVMTLTATCAGVPVAVVLRYRDPQAFVDVHVQVDATAANASAIRVLAAFEPDFASGATVAAVTSALQGRILAVKETPGPGIYAGFANPGPVWSNAFLGSATTLATDAAGGSEITSSSSASAAMAEAVQWNLGVAKGTRFVTFRVVASSTLEADADSDSIPDIVEKTLAGAAIDTDTDTTHDHQDTDDDGDGISTLIEAARGDTDGDGTPDYLDTDDDNDGILTSAEWSNAVGAVNDADGDGIPNYRDRDSDGDGLLDAAEHAHADGDADGVPNYLDLDSDDDGIVDAIEAGHGAAVASDGRLTCAAGVGVDGLCDALQASDSFSVGEAYPVANTDGDTLPNFVDVDSDGDGLKDGVEAGRGFIVDADGHVGTTGHDAGGLLPDVAALGATAEGYAVAAGAGAAAYLSTDADGDGLLDSAEGTGDFDQDGIPNFRDLDSDNDGIFDNIEGATASLEWDSDGDGVYDVEESGMPLTGLTLSGGKKITGAVGANGVVDAIESADTYAASHGGTHTYTLRNTDGDANADYRDTDDDDDGITTLVEGGTANADGDALPNYRDADDDGDGISTLTERTGDLNGDGVTGAADLDVDGDGVANHLDLDSDNDGITDAAEGAADAEGDGRPNFVDLDSDADGVFDALEAGYDTTGLTITSGHVQGAVGVNGFVDALETGDAHPVAGAHAPSDTDSDGVRDFLDRDSDNDGLLDADESSAADGDADGTPNRLDLDSDGDGVTDAHEAGFTTSTFTISAAGRITGLAGSGATIAAVVGTDGFANALQVGSVDGYGVAKSYTITNSDNADQPNYLDTDDDNDSVTTLVEAAHGDTDGDGTPDHRDTDDDNDGILTSAEWSNAVGAVNDADGDGLPNYRDRDSDGDGLLDAAEHAHANGDADGVPNYLDLDSDDDGIVDAIEAGHGAAVASNARLACAGGVGVDGLCDALQGSDSFAANANYTVANTDGDTLPNFVDVDSDGDGLKDGVEAGRGFIVDADGHVGTTGHDAGGLLPDVAALGATADGYAVAAGASAAAYLSTDADGDGLLDSAEGTGDFDQDGIPNFRDLDSDNDGIFDSVEGATASLEWDSDGDGVYDVEESGMPLTGLTLSGGKKITGAVGANGVVDAIESADTYAASHGGTHTYTLRNTDGDANADYRDTDDDNDGMTTLVEGGTANADGDSLPNYRDADDDGDGISTLTERTGDLNGDGVTGAADLDVDGDGVANHLDLDSDNDGITDAAEGAADTEGDGRPNFVDLDSDADGVFDAVEAGYDTTGLTITSGRVQGAVGVNGFVDALETGDAYPVAGAHAPSDTDSDGVRDFLDRDSDNDGLLDADESSAADGDADGTPNRLDLDSDGDGVTDAHEAGFTTSTFTISAAGRITGLAGSGATIAAVVGTDGFANALQVGSVDGYGVAKSYTITNSDNADQPNYLDTDDDNDGVTTLVEAARGDTDGDGTPDYLDTDDDNDGILTSAEWSNAVGAVNDADGDGLPNYRDRDSDGDGLLDAAEHAHADGDADGVPNYLDLDSDDDGIVDAIEAGHGAAVASNARLACAGGVGVDGLCDALQGSDSFAANANYTVANTDGDTLPNFVDVDSDGDGLKDGVEAGRGFIVDADGHVGTTGHDAGGLLPDVAALGATADGYAVAAGAGAAAYLSTDADGDGLLDSAEGTGDFDQDGIPNFRDLDSDNDGIFDNIEGATGSTNWDSDSDGVFDVVESGMPLTGLTLTDGKKISGAVGANGVVDAIESADTYAASHGGSHTYTLRNTDGDANADYRDTDDDNDGITTLVEGGTANADGDSLPNYRDADDDGDGISTLTERTGDLNGDGVTGAADLDVDGDGVANHLDLDSDNDGITDAAEGVADAEGDGRPNFVDLDSDADGVFDAIEAGYDTTGLTITSGRVQGAVGVNGFVDALETGDAHPVAGAHAPSDTDSDGVRDFLDRDSDNDGLLDADESSAADGDADGAPNRLDLDSDGDGVTDAHEAGFTTSTFTISAAGRITGLAGSGATIAAVVGTDGFANALQVGSVDGYGVAKSYTITNSDNADQPNYLDTDDDNDGLATSAERNGDLDGSGATNAADLDLDNDGVANHLDLDSDNDGLADALEGLTDTDGDGLANFADLDSDADGIADVYEAGFATATLTISSNRLTGALGSNGILDALETSANAWPLALNYLARDTDSDGRRDALDRDTDDDGLLDGEEGRTDTDGDGVPNFRDLDSDNDGIVDAIEAGHGAAVDTSARLTCAAGVGSDGLCDSLQASDGFAIGVNYTVLNTDGDTSPVLPDFLDTDSDNDTVFDADEAERGFVVDAATGRVQGTVDANGLVAAVAALGSTASGYAPASSRTGIPAYRATDADGDGIPDGTEGRTDADGDGVPNYRDLDSDNDGILDATETASKFLTLDSDGDGVNDVYEAGLDTSLFVINADGRITGLAGNPISLSNLVGANGLVSTLESADTYAASVTYTLRNTDGDAQADYLDTDDDGDGLATSLETGSDADGDGLPNCRDLDADNDGLLDAVEGSSDADSDGTKNFLDLDSDGDGINDVVEAGFSLAPFTITSGRIAGLAGSGLTLAAIVGANGLAATLETGDAFPAVPNYVPRNTDGTGGIDAFDADDDEDGIATSVETDADLDGDLVPNFRDLDSDADGIPDATEFANARGATKDSDADGTADYWDDDSDGDGIFDATEAGHGAAVDPVTGRISGAAVGGNGVAASLQTGAAYPAVLTYTLRNTDVGMDSVPDYLDLDADQDGIPDATEGLGDLDADNTPNYRDLDADGDGVRDATEAGHRRALNTDGRVTGNAGSNGLVNTLEDVDTYAASVSYAIRDTNSDGEVDPLDTDDDGDGILTLTEGTTDSDSDSYANYLDLDSDNDGIDDSVEGTRNPDGDAAPNYVDLDSDGDTFSDAVEAGHGQSVTPQGRVSGGVDANGRPLAVVNLGGYTIAQSIGGGYAFESNDSDGDGISDNVEGTADPDGDGVPNNRDRDSDNDGILDAVEGSGDLDDDNVPNYLDLDTDGDGVFDAIEAGHGRTPTNGRLTGAVGTDGFANALQATDSYAAAPNYTLLNTDGDSKVDYVDTDDDGDGIATKDETTADTDGDAVANYLDLDVDNDGIGDVDETAADPDGDGTPSYRDLDSDGDGISDIDEAGHSAALGLTVTNGRIAAPVGANGFVDALETGDAYPVVRKAALRNTDSDVFADYLDTDDDNDGIPTVTETSADRDADGVPNHRDLDADNDGIADATERGSGAAVADTDGDGTANFLDADSDEDGLPDVYEAGHQFAYDAGSKRITGAVGANGLLDLAESADTYAASSRVTLADSDSDGVEDYLDRDSDNDGIADASELAADPDNDAKPNYLDLDADGDGVFDANEAGHSLTIDAQGRVTANVGANGLANAVESGDTYVSTMTYALRDTDGDATPNFLDTDDDGDGILSAIETTANADGDGLPNFLDLDSDNDGIADAIEGTRNADNDALPNYLDLDADGDGISDALEAGHGQPVDPTGRVSGTTDATGVPSTVAALGGYTLALASNGVYAFETGDTDGDGILDGVEGSADPDNDGRPNFRDRDSDNDGILDSIEGVGDTDGDGVANYLDLDSDGDGVFDATEAGHGLAISAEGRVLGLVGQNGYANDLENNDSFSSTSTYTPANADGDAQPNFLDTDDDGDGLATTTETAADADGDGVPNHLDLDADNDGIVDATEGLGGSDGDGVPSYLDLDSDGDGIFDAVEAGYPLTGLSLSAGRLVGNVGSNGLLAALETGDAYPAVLRYGLRDTDSDARADYLDDDDDNDGIRTALEGSSDDDGDTLPNHRDLDADNDGLSDAAEKGSGATPADTDGDGIADFLDLDSDQDGIADAIEAGHGFTTSSGRVTLAVGDNGLVNAGESNDTFAAVGTVSARSTDQDGIPDHLDRDADGDGIPDSVEGVTDPDADQLPSYLDADADGDGIFDAVEAGHGRNVDGNGRAVGAVGSNGLVNAVEQADTFTSALLYTLRDTDADGASDYLDTDDDNDLIPTRTEGVGDSDGDGVLDYRDLDSDNDGLTDRVETTFDTDGDGVSNYLDLDSDADGLVDAAEAGHGATSTAGRVTGAVGANGLPDAVEANGVDGAGPGYTVLDSDGDAYPNFRDIDDDNDGLPTSAELSADGSAKDTDGDGTPDHVDLDADGDGIFDAVEAGHGAATDGDGRVLSGVNAYGLPTAVASTSDGRAINYTVTLGVGGAPTFLLLDSDGDGISDSVERGTGLTVADTDGDGVPDLLDRDSDQDGIPDSAERDYTRNGVVVWDTDNDTIPDFRDLDSDGDGIADAIEAGHGKSSVGGVVTLAACTAWGVDGFCNTLESADAYAAGVLYQVADTDNDRTPDFRDDDSDGDGITDATERGPTATPLDTDGDGIANYKDLDSDADMIPDAVERVESSGPVNSDADALPDYIDVDSDNDGILDILEAGPSPSTPRNSGGDATKPDYRDRDSDGDGIWDAVEAGHGLAQLNGQLSGIGADGYAAALRATSYVLRNYDGDSLEDYRDADSDNDGVNDSVEAGNPDSPRDSDRDGQPDYRDDDDDNDGLLSALEVGAGTTPSNVDGDSLPDYLDLDSDNDGMSDSYEGPVAGQPLPRDTDGDGLFDFRDSDSDGDDIPDADERGGGSTPADTDGDGVIDARDRDTDGDGILDRLEGSADADGDGRGNYRDIDSDSDGIPDVIEAGFDPAVVACTGDCLVVTAASYGRIPVSAINPATGVEAAVEALAAFVPRDTDRRPGETPVPDFLDLDSDDDGIGDAVERGPTLPPRDSDGDGLPDYIDLDSDGDGIADATERVNVSPNDQDRDGIPDYLDNDSDNDGISDRFEAGGMTPPRNSDDDPTPDYLDTDSDNDTISDEIERRTGTADAPEDNDGDGLPNYIDRDSDADSIPDRIELAADVDGDSRANYVDLDSDNDGILDRIEAGNPESPSNVDGDTLPDYLDLDSDGDGIYDAIESGLYAYLLRNPSPPLQQSAGMVNGSFLADGWSDLVRGLGSAFVIASTDVDTVYDFRDLDSDNDGVLDALEIGRPPLTNEVADTDGDKVPDFVDMDSDGDDVPDSWERGTGAELRNTDRDSEPDIRDIDSDNDGIHDYWEFRKGALTLNAATGRFEYGADAIAFADTDSDGVLDIFDLDSDNDGIPDDRERGQFLENAAATGLEGKTLMVRPMDWDGDGTPDFRDNDSDGDGIYDVVEAGSGFNYDRATGRLLTGENVGFGANGLLTPFEADDLYALAYTKTIANTDAPADIVQDFRDLDTDQDGITDKDEGSGGLFGEPRNTDGTDVPDFRDLDSDQDGLADVYESGAFRVAADGTTFVATFDASVVVVVEDRKIKSPFVTPYGLLRDLSSGPAAFTYRYSVPDSDGDNVANFRDRDSDNDGLLDDVERGSDIPRDRDGDGIWDVVDIDADNDRILDVYESGVGVAVATLNGRIDITRSPVGVNGFADVLEQTRDAVGVLITYAIADTDGDSVPDFVDDDADNDGILDVEESGVLPNSVDQPVNTDGVGEPDYRDIDSDEDGIYDVVEAQVPTSIATLNGRIVGVVGTNGRILGGVPYGKPVNTDKLIGLGVTADDTPDFQDLDSDGDGIFDAVERGNAPFPPLTDRKFDFDGDGVGNYVDPDSDDDGIPDVVEALPFYTSSGVAPIPTDTDRDGAYDFLDADADNDTVLDRYEGCLNLLGCGPVTAGGAVFVPEDSDGDQTPDFRDLDSDSDGLPDATEVGVAGGLPTNSDENPTDGADFRDKDSDDDTIGDAVECPGGDRRDFDNDSKPNCVDADADADGIGDVFEARLAGAVVTDVTVGIVDTDGDGTPDYLDTDSDNDTISDADERGVRDIVTSPIDTDGDVLADFRDRDSDNDGLTDGYERGGLASGVDSDFDGTPDYRDTDSDDDAIADAFEARAYAGTLQGGSIQGPVGTNGIPDVVEVTPDSGTFAEEPYDTDLDGVPDFRDTDSDADGVDDEVEQGGGSFDASPRNTDGRSGASADAGVGIGDTIPDFRDADADNDTIPDRLERAMPPGGSALVGSLDLADTDRDGVPDYLDLDSDNDGILDREECWGGDVASSTASCDDPVNSDAVAGAPADGYPDYRDVDSDDDLLFDAFEVRRDYAVQLTGSSIGQVVGASSSVGDGTVDATLGRLTDALPDEDGDRVSDYRDADSDGDGIGDRIEGGKSQAASAAASLPGCAPGAVDGAHALDFDCDTKPDYLDKDSDNDGVSDALEHDPKRENLGIGVSFAMPGRADPCFRDLDCDDDTISDAIEVFGVARPTDAMKAALTALRDTSRDGTPDMVSLDSDDDGHDDELERRPTGVESQSMDDLPVDTDGDGVPDYVDYDSDNDGIRDTDERTSEGEVADSDECAPAAEITGGPFDPARHCNPANQDGIDDFRDGDSDGDGLPDAYEAGHGCTYTNENGKMTLSCERARDDGSVGLVACDFTGTGFCDLLASKGDSRLASYSLLDTDSDGYPDFQDRDADNDELPDSTEAPGGKPKDSNNDGIPDHLQVDSTGEGINDGYRVRTGGLSCSAAAVRAPSSGFALFGFAFALGAVVLRRRSRRSAVAVALVARAAAAAEPVPRAQEGGFDAETFRLPMDAEGIIDVETARTSPWLDMSVHLMQTQGAMQLEKTVNDKLTGYVVLVDQRQSATLQFSMPVWKLEVGATLPLITGVTRSNGSLPDFGGFAAEPVNPSGLGDARIAAKYVRCRDDVCRIGWGFIGAFVIPTGNTLAFNGEGVPVFDPEFIASSSLGPLRLAANLGYRLRLGKTESRLPKDNVVTYRAGASYRFGDHDAFGVDATVGGQSSKLDPSPEGEPLTGLEATGALSYGIGRARISLGAGQGLLAAYGVPQFRGFLNLRWAPLPPPPDRDGDNVPDVTDACPDVGGTPSEEPSRNGCPVVIVESDVDNDGFDDTRDACPQEAGVANDDPMKHGCPPPAPDADGDGVADERDACPLEPGVATDDDRNGCAPPPRDPDGDGIDDTRDACPDEPGTANIDPSRNGCRVGAVQGAGIVLDPVIFQAGSAELAPFSIAALERIALVVEKLPSRLHYRLEGHADEPGTRTMRRELSLKRARAVQKWLDKRGFDPHRFVPVGFGADRARPGEPMRRVEFAIIAEKGRHAN